MSDKIQQSPTNDLPGEKADLRKSQEIPSASSNLHPELYARLKAESKAPYRGLRQVVYITLGGSGFVGVVVFLSQAIAGADLGNTLPNLILQIGVVALMVWLYRWEEQTKKRQRQSRSIRD